jgi:hypothetical protein
MIAATRLLPSGNTAYYAILPASCIGKNMSPTNLQTALLYIYHDIRVATVWNWYRSFRMHLHEVLLHCITLLHSHPLARSQSIDPKESLEQSHSMISDVLSEICASVPFCIGDIDSAGKPAKTERRMPLYGHLVFWVLYVTSASAESGSTQDLWIREKLEYVSNFMRIRKQRARLLATRIKKEPEVLCVTIPSHINSTSWFLPVQRSLK